LGALGMPKYNFLGKEKKLNNNNFKELVLALYNKSKIDIAGTKDKISDYYKGIEKKTSNEKLDYFISITKKYISEYNEDFLIRSLRISPIGIKKYAIAYLKEKVLKYCSDNAKKEELIGLLDNGSQNKNISVSSLTNLVRNSLDDKYKDQISDSSIDYIPNDVIIKQFSKYVDLLESDISSMEDSSDIYERIGIEMNNHMSIYDYSYDSPLTTPKYVDEANEIINHLKDEQEIKLSNRQIDEYSNVLNHANILFGAPIINIESLEKDKIEIDNAIAYNHFNNAKENLRKKGFEVEIIKAGKNNKYGYYNKVNADKNNELNDLRNNTNIQFSNDTKKCLLNIIDLIRESKLEKDYIINDSNEKVYGFNKLRELGQKYKEAITSNNIEDKMKAIAYANEIKELDENISNILTAIEKYMPLEEDNLAFENDLDLLNNKDIPAKYRMDYQRIAHLSTLCSLINLVDKHGLDINDFLDEPSSFLRDLYQKEFLVNVDPSLNNKGLSGVDLLFNLSKRPDENVANEFLKDIPKLAIGLTYFEKDKKQRMENASKVYAMNETVFKPFTFAHKYDSYNLNNSIDRLIINPNLNFDDLKLRYYDPNKLSIVNMDEIGFDEIEFIKNSSESLEDFKTRFDENILKYMKLEADYIRENNNVDSVYFKTSKYIELASKALAKVLIVKKEDQDRNEYQELKKFLTNKKAYVNSLIDSIPNNPKYSEYLAVKELKDKEIVVNNKIYKINTFERQNEIANVLDNYERFVVRQKEIIKTDLKDFLRDEKNSSNDLKKKYDEYNIAFNIYQKMIEKTYGPNYKGEINNLLNDDIKESFRAYTDKRQSFENAKASYLKNLDDKVKSGVIPSSYFMDRSIQLEVNDFSKLPPLFRSDSLMDRDEYIKFRYPSEFETLSNEEKDLIFDRYKYEINSKENDFFSRKYLEIENLTLKNERTIQKSEPKEIDKIDYRLLENRFLNIEKKYINALDYERPHNLFNELTALRMQSDSISDFKKNLDEKILNIIEGYDKGLKDLPSIENVIDYSQKAALKYLLVVSTYNRNSDEAKSLSDFLVDGRAYVNNLIKHENEKSLIDNQIKYDIKKAKIDELSINKYANSMRDFNDYYNKEIKKTEIHTDLLYEEEDASNVLRDLNKYAKDLRNEKRFVENNIMFIPSEPPACILALAGITREKYLAMSIDEKIQDCQESYDYILDGIYTILDYYYSRGHIPAEYVIERMNRLKNKNFDIPSKFTVDGLPGMNKYIKSKYPTLAQELTYDEKKNIYLNYIHECDENRRQFILRNYFTEKGLTEKRLHDIEALDLPRIGEEKSTKEVQNLIYDEIENNLKIEKDKVDSVLPEFDNLSEISVEDINLNDMAELDLLDSVNPKELAKEEVDYIRKHDHFSKWIDNLKKVIKEEIGEEEYELQSIEENFKYDPVKDSFNYWLDDHIQALDMIFEDNLNDVFSSATKMLDNESKDIFVKEIVNLPEFRKYFENEIQEFAYTPLYESPAKDDYNLASENAVFTDFVKQLKKDLDEREIEFEDDDELELSDEKEIEIIK
jgi:hypothetical protein